MYHTFHSMDSFSLQSKSNIYITYWVSDTFSLQSKSNLLVLALSLWLCLARRRKTKSNNDSMRQRETERWQNGPNGYHRNWWTGIGRNTQFFDFGTSMMRSAISNESSNSAFWSSGTAARHCLNKAFCTIDWNFICSSVFSIECSIVVRPANSVENPWHGCQS